MVRITLNGRLLNQNNKSTRVDYYKDLKTLETSSITQMMNLQLVKTSKKSI
jgi:hypothetical protein